MATKKQAAPHWLTRPEIQDIIDRMSAADLVRATDDGISSGERAEIIFNRATERLGRSNGVAGMEMVKASDFPWLAEKLGEVMTPDSPKADSGQASPDSAASGE